MSLPTVTWQSVNFAFLQNYLPATIGELTLLSDLVAAAGRNKRARAVQLFRDGLSFLSKDDCEKALPYFEKADESDINYAEAWAQAGFCNEKLGRHTEAIEASKKAVSLRPSAESYFNIGLANYYLKQYREAAVAYRQAIRIDPYNAADAYYALGLAYRDWGRADDEIQAYKQAIRLRSDYTSAYERLGSSISLQEVFRALEVFKQLANLNPESSSTHNSGRIWSGRVNDAVEVLGRRSIETDLGEHINLGKCLLAMATATPRSSSTILQNLEQTGGEMESLITLGRGADGRSRGRNRSFSILIFLFHFPFHFVLACSCSCLSCHSWIVV